MQLKHDFKKELEFYVKQERKGELWRGLKYVVFTIIITVIVVAGIEVVKQLIGG